MSYCKTIGNGYTMYTRKLSEEDAELVNIEFTKEPESFTIPTRDHMGRKIASWEKPSKVSVDGLYWPSTLIVPDTITKIGSLSWLPCQTIIMPSSIKKIQSQQFSYNRKIDKILLPKSTKIISSGAFKKCGNEDNPCHIVIPDTCTAMGDSCFEGAHLGYLRWPSHTSYIPSLCFEGATIDCLDLSAAIIFGGCFDVFVGTRIKEIRLPYYPANTDYLYKVLEEANILEMC